MSGQKLTIVDVNPFKRKRKRSVFVYKHQLLNPHLKTHKNKPSVVEKVEMPVKSNKFRASS